MGPKLTEWFGPDVKPTIPGVYEVEPDSGSPWYSYWDGSRWGYITCSGVDHAFHSCATGEYESMDSWRGLAEKPE